MTKLHRLRRSLEVLVLGITGLLLIATSAPTARCEPGTTRMEAKTSCAPPTIIALTVDRGCLITVTEGAVAAGLPAEGGAINTDIFKGFALDSFGEDGGVPQRCQAVRIEGGDRSLRINCTNDCSELDAGIECPIACSGILTPP